MAYFVCNSNVLSEYTLQVSGIVVLIVSPDIFL